MARLPLWEQDLLRRLNSKDWEVYCYEQVDSTMDVARENCNAIDAGKLLILAKQQSLGRGRQGREWESTPGAFLATFVFQTETDFEEVKDSWKMVGLCLYRILETYLPGVVLKCPNDILYNHKKIAGIIIEHFSLAGKSFLSAGIGVNLQESPVGSVGTSIFEETGISLHPLDLAVDLAGSLEQDLLDNSQEITLEDINAIGF